MGERMGGERPTDGTDHERPAEEGRSEGRSAASPVSFCSLRLAFTSPFTPSHSVHFVVGSVSLPVVLHLLLTSGMEALE